MRDWRVRSGIGLGLALAAGVVAVGGLPRHRSHGAIVSDSQGAIDEVVIHYVSESAPVVERVYRSSSRSYPTRSRSTPPSRTKWRFWIYAIASVETLVVYVRSLSTMR